MFTIKAYTRLLAAEENKPTQQKLSTQKPAADKKQEKDVTQLSDHSLRRIAKDKYDRRQSSAVKELKRRQDAEEGLEDLDERKKNRKLNKKDGKDSIIDKAKSAAGKVADVLNKEEVEDASSIMNELIKTAL